MKKLGKSAVEVLNAIDGIARIKKHNKYHDRAVVQLKAAGIIEKGPDNILRRVKQYGIELPARGVITARWMTQVWKRHAGKKVVAFVVYGDSRAESMDIADRLIDQLEAGNIL